MSAPPTSLLILGSGTVVPDHRHLPAAYVLEGRGASVLVDCGPGALARMSEYGVPWQDLEHVAVTHFHDDHVGGLRGLFQAWKYGMEPPRTRPLSVLGPGGTVDLLDQLGVAEPHLGGADTFRCTVRDLLEGERLRLGAVEVCGRSTPHTPESMALRFETPDGAVGMTGDTGPSRAVAEFLAGCRVVVAECSWRDPLPAPVHLSPATLAEMAATMRPELLVVTHVYPTHMSPEAALEGIAQAGYGGRAVAARDGMRVRLDPDGPTVDARGNTRLA